MDSLTQIILGAAVGEVAAGRKIGNRAMLWGAIAGTIPDLDVMIGSLFMNEINGLAFHRAITHSIFFAVVFSFLISYYTNWLYSNEHHRKRGYKILTTAFGILFMFLASAILIFISKTLGGTVGMILSALLTLGLVSYFSARLLRGYLNTEQEKIDIGYWSWYKLFFWAIFTHPLLDCFTVYGTQLFAPFSNYRVALNNISVADPAYTFPFLICLMIASLLARRYDKESKNEIGKSFKLTWANYKLRSYVNAAGIIISSLYLGWTFYNKAKINKIMEQTLADQNIIYSRYMTGPTILNNLLWSATAETDSSYYTGLYSLYDKEPKFKLFEVPKNYGLLDYKSDDKVINTLRWFSKDYYSVMRRKDGLLQINDMRYGAFDGEETDENSFIFRFILNKGENGYYKMENAIGGPKRGSEGEIFGDLFKRIRGI
ncbi:MAG: inner membrane protein [Saprospiraceae bacterium]|jgi:inner membrane protein